MATEHISCCQVRIVDENGNEVQEFIPDRSGPPVYYAGGEDWEVPGVVDNGFQQTRLDTLAAAFEREGWSVSSEMVAVSVWSKGDYSVIVPNRPGVPLFGSLVDHALATVARLAGVDNVHE